MPLDSDENGADSKLFVEFYEQERMPDRGKVYVRIMVPGDKLNIIDTRNASRVSGFTTR